MQLQCSLNIIYFPEPCPEQFTRVGSDCYHFGSDAGREYDWKIASNQCRKLKGFLAETERTIGIKELSSYIISKPHLSGESDLKDISFNSQIHVSTHKIMTLTDQQFVDI